MTIRVITNNQPRLLLDWDQLTSKERADFSYLSEDERIGRDFVRYRSVAYDLGEFLWATADLKGWEGYQCDSFFSGVVMRRHPGDTDRVVMGTYRE